MVLPNDEEDRNALAQVLEQPISDMLNAGESIGVIVTAAKVLLSILPVQKGLLLLRLKLMT